MVSQLQTLLYGTLGLFIKYLLVIVLLSGWFYFTGVVVSTVVL